MACGYVFRIDRVGIVKQPTELDPVVALHAWVGRSSVLVFIDEVIDNAFEVFFKIQCIEGDTHFVRYTACISSVARAATSLFVIESALQDGQKGIGFSRIQFARLARFLAMPHEDANDLKPLFLEQMSRDAGVYSAAHR
jgi:hypothetical protein